MSEIERWSQTGGEVPPMDEYVDGDYVTFTDHQQREQELLRLLREWSGTGIADCHCWNTDLRKRTDAVLEAK
jgi:hypothetical protein